MLRLVRTAGAPALRRGAAAALGRPLSSAAKKDVSYTVTADGIAMIRLDAQGERARAGAPAAPAHTAAWHGADGRDLQRGRCPCSPVPCMPRARLLACLARRAARPRRRAVPRRVALVVSSIAHRWMIGCGSGAWAGHVRATPVAAGGAVRRVRVAPEPPCARRDARRYARPAIAAQPTRVACARRAARRRDEHADEEADRRV